MYEHESWPEVIADALAGLFGFVFFFAVQFLFMWGLLELVEAVA
ncbi:hypothetical protein GCM10022243_48370 [Saccharothrix violaceirubra]|uniref:Uncharacterized protein n=1 Tax=Saccharothrix violaceirubra TaxID=413306 RepID=A0A7W7T015_9PSEU|nr:hypothetical protein [Saccharothrix violaceirubra]MBB4963821.1 hypothetical protein [Saccharothrix violaceirubra]